MNTYIVIYHYASELLDNIETKLIGKQKFENLELNKKTWEDSDYIYFYFLEKIDKQVDILSIRKYDNNSFIQQIIYYSFDNNFWCNVPEKAHYKVVIDNFVYVLKPPTNYPIPIFLH
jgi:hypothetical protein